MTFKRRKCVRTIVAALTIGVAGSLFAASPASAAPDQSASGGQCLGGYDNGGIFFINDNDGGDSDYCYILYTWNAGGGGRINHPQDYDPGNWYAYQVSGTPGSTEVTWSVCKERENDPDICSGGATDPIF